MSDEIKKETTEVDEKAAREKTFARRALLQAGWAIPAVIAFNMPGKAHAGSAHIDNFVHSDINDVPTTPHTDNVPHQDNLVHNDHVDGILGPHGDHGDVP